MISNYDHIGYCQWFSICDILNTLLCRMDGANSISVKGGVMLLRTTVLITFVAIGSKALKSSIFFPDMAIKWSHVRSTYTFDEVVIKTQH